MQLLDSFHSTSKINLYLDILGRDPLDGYHFIESIFTEINWGDHIKIFSSSKDKIQFDIDENIIPKENTVSKTLFLFKEKYKIKESFYIEIEKKVPIGSGLGGGSGDAGAIIHWMAKRYKIDPLSCLDIAYTVGSDVPFFLFGKTAYVSGKGEKIQILQGKIDPGINILILCPKMSISSKKAYSSLGLNPGFRKQSEISNIFFSKQYWDVDTLKKVIYNVFDIGTERENLELYSIKKYIQERLSPDYVFMTGSGSGLVLFFKEKSVLDRAMSLMDKTLFYPAHFIQAI